MAAVRVILDFVRMKGKGKGTGLESATQGTVSADCTIYPLVIQYKQADACKFIPHEYGADWWPAPNSEGEIVLTPGIEPRALSFKDQTLIP